MVEPQLLHGAKAELGEGPVWSSADNAVYWVDIEGRRLLRYDLSNGVGAEFAMPSEIGCVAERQAGGLIVGLRTGICFFDPATAHLDPVLDLEGDKPGNRLNDGKCDSRGRFFVGSMDAAQKLASGSLYRIDPDLSMHRLDRDYRITNGPAFSPDGKVLYHNDSAKRLIYAYDYDLDGGALSNRRVFAEIQDGEGYPDGITTDADGSLWCAVWGGWRIDRYKASGELVESVPLPVMCPTSLTFGGDDLRTLFVTSARIALDAKQKAEQQLAGALIALDMNVQGLPTHKFNG